MESLSSEIPPAESVPTSTNSTTQSRKSSVNSQSSQSTGKKKNNLKLLDVSIKRNKLIHTVITADEFLIVFI